jgi:hypothetical protein
MMELSKTELYTARAALRYLEYLSGLSGSEKALLDRLDKEFDNEQQ